MDRLPGVRQPTTHRSDLLAFQQETSWQSASPTGAYCKVLIWVQITKAIRPADTRPLTMSGCLNPLGRSRRHRRLLPVAGRVGLQREHDQGRVTVIAGDWDSGVRRTHDLGVDLALGGSGPQGCASL